MHGLTDVELQVLDRIKPRKEEYEIIWRSYEKIKSIIENYLVTRGVHGEVTIQGSIAHDTWLSGDRDLDIFVLFPGDWSREDIEKKGFTLLLEVAQEIGSYELRYAEHPYIRVKFGEVEADIVPGLKLLDPSLAKTSVDRTPFHTKYLNNVLTEELRDHIRLLKKFMKAIGIYGAELKTRGFSGYAVELLVSTYKGFRDVLENASKWKPPVFVNTIGGNLTKDIVRELRSKYPDSCIYMPDPVDPLRNVTASVSSRSLATLSLASKCYLRNPSTLFFEEPPEPKLDELIKALEHRCIIMATYFLVNPLPPDVIWGEVTRIVSRLAKMLEALGLRIIDHSAWTNERDIGVIGIELEECKLSMYKHYKGPCLEHENSRLMNFIRKHFNKGYGPWINKEGCLDSMDLRMDVNVIRILESKWSEYTVAPHLKNIKPIVELADESSIKKLLELGAGKWLRELILKTPIWMEKCIF